LTFPLYTFLFQCTEIRSLRWLDRSIAAHSRNDEQSIFPIVQGGLDPKLREQSVKGE